MDRIDLQQLSKEQLIELVLRLQRPDKSSRTSSKPPSTDKKEKRENARPGGAKLGHEPHNRRLADDPDAFRDHMPMACQDCGGAISSDDPRELIGVCCARVAGVHTAIFEMSPNSRDHMDFSHPTYFETAANRKRLR